MGLFSLSSGLVVPRGLTFLERLWWRFVPGEVIKVRWPRGKIKVNADDTKYGKNSSVGSVIFESTDPNDFYRPWLEANIGKQGWDWQWGLGPFDVNDNKLTIKIRKKYCKHKLTILLMWG